MIREMIGIKRLRISRLAIPVIDGSRTAFLSMVCSLPVKDLYADNLVTVQSQAQIHEKPWIQLLKSMVSHGFASGEHAATPEMAFFAISGV